MPEPLPCWTSASTLRTVIEALRGHVVDRELALHCVWHFIGYSLGRHYENEAAGVAGPDQPLTAEKLADWLDGFLPDPEGLQIAHPAWLRVAAVLAPLLLRLLPSP